MRFAINDDAGAGLRARADSLLSIRGQRKKPKKTDSMGSCTMSQMII